MDINNNSPETTGKLIHDLLVSLQELSKWIKVDIKKTFEEHALNVVREDKMDPIGRTVKEFKDLYYMMPLGPCGRTAAQICITNKILLETHLNMIESKYL